MGGVVAQVGVLTAGSDESLPIATILHKQARIQGIYVGSRSEFEEMNRAVAQAQLRPVYESFPWSQARQVRGAMEKRSHFGKLALTLS
jgi:D-arabinose 1-dehydrogenase-like Zn-dependent alcohol dehydrogenase